jgi:allantoinase
VWTAARGRQVALETVVGWMSTAPAALAGLSAKGAIAPGRDADLVVFAPDASFVVDPARLHHRHPVTPYAGRELTGVVRDVWLRGHRVVTDGDVAAEPRGRLLRRDTT